MNNRSDLLPPEGPLSKAWFHFCYWVSAAATITGFSLRTEGQRYVPRQGPALLVANHQSFIDPVLIGLAARRELCYMARKTLFVNPIFTWLIRSLNAVPVNQEGFAREGLQAVLTLLQADKAVVVFPEGERTRTGKMNPLRPGVHLLIKKATVPIVPVGIAGAFHAWPRWQPLPIPAPLFLPAWEGTIAVSIGKPITSQYYAGMERAKVLEDLYTRIHDCVLQAEKLRRKE